MKHNAVMFVADKVFNEMMRCCDLKPDYKWFVKPVPIEFETSTTVDEMYFRHLIEKSKENGDVWFPVVQWCGTLFRDKDVKIISDGEKEYFVEGLDKQEKEVAHAES